MKDKNEQHHLSDADLEKLTKEELIFLVKHERGHFNEAADRLMNTLIGTERELKSWQDKLVDHIDTATSKIDTSNWKQKEDKEELKRLRPALLDFFTARKENDNE